MWRIRKGFRLPVDWWTRAGERLDLGLSPERAFFSPSQRLRREAVSGLERVRLGLEEGYRLSESLRQAGLELPLHLWALIETGERTGLTGAALREIGEQLAAARSRRQRLSGQLWYPGLVFLTACSVMGLILVWVIPRLRELGKEMGGGAELPWFTEYLGWIYGGALCGCATVLLAGWGLVLTLHRLGSRSLRFSQWAENLYAALPLAGTYRTRSRESRLLDQLAVLLCGGYTLPEALQLLSSRSVQRHEQTELARFRERLLNGGGFDAALRDCPLVSVETSELLEVGQECGKLDQYMRRIAEAHVAYLDALRERGLRLLEPVFLLVLTAAVGGLIIAYLLPFVQLLEQAGPGS